MKRERKKLRVQLVDEDMILLKVPDKGIVEWKILQVSKDFVEFEYALDDVIFRPGEWNECRREHIRHYVLDQKKQKIWRATVAYTSALIDLKAKRPFVFSSHGKLMPVKLSSAELGDYMCCGDPSKDIEPRFYQLRGFNFNRLPMQNIRPIGFFAESGKTYELKVVEL